jgi:hypothetical protein
MAGEPRRAVAPQQQPGSSCSYRAAAGVGALCLPVPPHRRARCFCAAVARWPSPQHMPDCREGGQRLLSTQQESAASLGLGIEASASPPRLPRSEERGALLKGQGPASSSSGGLQTAASPPMPPPFFPPAARHKHGGSGSPGGDSPAAGASPKAGKQQQQDKDKGGSKLSLFEDDDDMCPTCLEPYTGGCACAAWLRGALDIAQFYHRFSALHHCCWPANRRWRVACKRHLASLQRVLTSAARPSCPALPALIYPACPRPPLPSEDNPKVLTRCSHHFHLPCLYEWLERSQTCPVCDRSMQFEELL